MHRLALIAAAVVVACLPYTFFPDNPDWWRLDASWAGEKGGHGGGQGHGGSGGSMGGGGHHGGGGHGGSGGHGGGNPGGGAGGGGGHAGSAPAAPSAPVVSSGGAASAYTRSDQYGLESTRTREQVESDLRACNRLADVGYDTRSDGSFTYWGLEMHLPDFAQCLYDKGYAISSPPREILTNFGTRR